MGTQISLTMHFLDFHLEFFPENNGDVSDKHGKRFHQDFKVFEERYEGNVRFAMMVDFCWSPWRDTDKDLCRKRKYPQH